MFTGPIIELDGWVSQFVVFLRIGIWLRNDTCHGSVGLSCFECRSKSANVKDGSNGTVIHRSSTRTDLARNEMGYIGSAADM